MRTSCRQDAFRGSLALLAAAALTVALVACPGPGSQEVGTVEAPTITVTGSGLTRTVTMSCATSGATIYYTVNGKTASTTADPYGEVAVPYVAPLTVAGYGVTKSFSAIAQKSTASSSETTKTVTIPFESALADRGWVQPLAGQAAAGRADGKGSEASFSGPQGMATDGSYLYVADTENSLIRKIDIATGEATTLAGSGVVGNSDGMGTEASFNRPQGLATDGIYLYVADTDNHLIRRILLTTGEVDTLAGSGSAGYNTTESWGSSVQFNYPKGLATNGTFLYIADSGNNMVRRMEIGFGPGHPVGWTYLMAGATEAGYYDASIWIARFNAPTGLATGPDYLYVADTGNNAIRTIPLSLYDDLVGTIAGSTTAGSADGTGGAASFDAPLALASDGTYVYVSDSGNKLLRRIEIASTEVTTLAGATGGSSDGDIASAGFSSPAGIVADSSALYLADGNSIRGILETKPVDNVEEAITAFGFSSPAVSGSISGTTITVPLPDGTDLSALKASFSYTGSTVYVDGTAQNSGSTVNDFRKPLSYQVYDYSGNAKTYQVLALRASDYLSSTVGIMRDVPGGTFQRDSTATNLSTVTGFKMGYTMITGDQFKAVMGSDPSLDTYDGHPASNISAYDAYVFCNELSLKEGLNPVYTIKGSSSPSSWGAVPTRYDADWDAVTANWEADGYRLPTVMEYMWAAMGATKDALEGDIVSGVNVAGYQKGYAGSLESGGGTVSIGDYAWTTANSDGSSHAGATKLPNELDIYDLTGNLFRWLWDRDIAATAYPSGTIYDYRGPSTGTSREARGGSYAASGLYAIGSRHSAGAYNKFTDEGFHIVCKSAYVAPATSGISGDVNLPGSTSLTVTLSATSVASGVSLTASGPAGYASYEWALDGVTIPGATSSSLTIATSGMAVGSSHTVSLFAEDSSGDAYSGSAVFRVKN